MSNLWQRKELRKLLVVCGLIAVIAGDSRCIVPGAHCIDDSHCSKEAQCLAGNCFLRQHREKAIDGEKPSDSRLLQENSKVELTSDAAPENSRESLRDGIERSMERASSEKHPIEKRPEKRCQSGAIRKCYLGPTGTKDRGLCRAGTEHCHADGSGYGPCRDQILPTAEICNGKDDDCDGKTDEDALGVGKACQDPSKKGECTKGHSVCEQGKLRCKTPPPAKPVCPGLVDADCDGLLDCEVMLQAGQFTMGTIYLPSRHGHDGPLHKVELTRNFTIWKFENSQGEFQQLMKYQPSEQRNCSTCPVEKVNWHEAAAFSNALSLYRGLSICYQCTGKKQQVRCGIHPSYQGNQGKDLYTCKGYRLPTEAEWEYAARAGTSGPHYGKIDDVAWYKGNTSQFPYPQPASGTKKPNAWGLYHMLGNVWEWTTGFWYAYPKNTPLTKDPIASSGPGDILMMRGGSVYSDGVDCIAGIRLGEKSTTSNKDRGFRVVRTH